MLKKDVKIGTTYAAKISGTVQPVTITGESLYGGWNGRNEKTGRAVRIKSAQKLRFEVASYTRPDGTKGWARA